MKILIVDDDSLITDLVESQLTAWGYEPVVFTKSVDALNVLTRPDAPRLAILDWEMPLIDGLNICRSIRRKNGDHTYIIMLTGNSSKEHIVKALQAGANDYILKPFDPENLKTRIEKGLQAIKLKSSKNGQ